MADTGAPLFLPKMALDGERLPSAKFNLAMDILNGLNLPSSGVGLYDDLVSFWPLDEPSGKRYDKVGTNHLTDNNTVTQAEGLRAPVAQFTSANSESLSIASNSLVQMGDIDFTISAWAYLDTIGADRAIVAKDSNIGGTREYVLMYETATLRFRFQVHKATDSQMSVLSDGLGAPAVTTWYFIVAWHDSVANTINIQVNNGTITSAATTGALQTPSTSAFRIGARDFSGFLAHMNGRIGRVRMWKRVTTAAERTFLYNSGNGDPLWV